MVSQFLEGLGRATAAAIGALFSQQADCMVEANCKDILDARQVGIGPIMQHKWSIAAKAGCDHLAIFRVFAHFAWQGKQLEGFFQIDGFDIPALRNG